MFKSYNKKNGKTDESLRRKAIGNNWWLLKYKNEADKNAGVKEIGLVVLANIGIRADSSQRDLIRSRDELNAVTYADHRKADIVRRI